MVLKRKNNIKDHTESQIQEYQKYNEEISENIKKSKIRENKKKNRKMKKFRTDSFCRKCLF